MSAAGDELRQLAAAAGIAASPAAAAALERYLDAMLVENRHVNLTAVRERAAALRLHALDALAVALLVDAAPRQAFDLGSGNGFPGVAVAALWPTARVTLCERTRKKTAAVERALHTAGAAFARTRAVWADAAQAPARQPEWRGAFDLIVTRAVAEPAVVARLARPLLAPGGRLLLWLTPRATLPAQLAGDLQLRGQHDYALPEPVARTRRVAAWG